MLLWVLVGAAWQKVCRGAIAIVLVTSLAEGPCSPWPDWPYSCDNGRRSYSCCCFGGGGGGGYWCRCGLRPNRSVLVSLGGLWNAGRVVVVAGLGRPPKRRSGRSTQKQPLDAYFLEIVGVVVVLLLWCVVSRRNSRGRRLLRGQCVSYSHQQSTFASTPSLTRADGINDKITNGT